MNITTEKIIAIVRLAVTLVAMVASAFGLIVDADSLFTIVVCVAAVAAAVVSWWKNNNLTDAAAKAQEYLDQLKSGEADGDA